MDMATAGVRRRARPPATANSGGSVKRRKIGIDFKFSRNPRCDTSSSDDDVSVSCCSSHGSSQTDMDKQLEFADLEHYEVGSAEVDTSTPPPHLRGDRRRGNVDASFSEVEEELEEEGMDSAKATLSELGSQDELTDADGIQLLPKVEAPAIVKPTEAEIEDFFAVAEAENLQHFKKKYNFDFAKEEPLEGRFEWRRCEQEKCK